MTQFMHSLIAFILWQLTWYFLKQHPIWQEEMRNWTEYILKKLFG